MSTYIKIIAYLLGEWDQECIVSLAHGIHVAKTRAITSPFRFFLFFVFSREKKSRYDSLFIIRFKTSRSGSMPISMFFFSSFSSCFSVSTASIDLEGKLLKQNPLHLNDGWMSVNVCVYACGLPDLIPFSFFFIKILLSVNIGTLNQTEREKQDGKNETIFTKTFINFIFMDSNWRQSIGFFSFLICFYFLLEDQQQQQNKKGLIFSLFVFNYRVIVRNCFGSALYWDE